MFEPTVTELAAAAAGDTDAVAALVRCFESELRVIARFYRLGRFDADDVSQTTWMRFLEHGRDVRDPSAVRAWLRTTARRECLRVLQRHVREVLDGNAGLGEAGEDELDSRLLAAERRAVLGGALRGLPERHGALMRVLASEPDLSYDEVSRRVGMPVGSIGPIRARSLERLRRHAPLRALHAAYR